MDRTTEEDNGRVEEATGEEGGERVKVRNGYYGGPAEALDDTALNETGKRVWFQTRTRGNGQSAEQWSNFRCRRGSS